MNGTGTSLWNSASRWSSRIVWDFHNSMLRLFQDYRHHVLCKVCHTLFTWTISQHEHKNLLRSFNYTMVMVPLDCIRHHCLTFRGSTASQQGPRPVSSPLSLSSSSASEFAQSRSPNHPGIMAVSLFVVFVKVHAPNLGWGLQVLTGTQAQGQWSKSRRHLHITAQELLAALFFLQSSLPSGRHQCAYGWTTVWCLQHNGSS